MSTDRSRILDELTVLILAVEVPHPTRVAIDGPDAAGKTTLADELATALQPYGREVIRASIDGFHHPRARRHARGRDSPVGYYEDSFDLHALRSSLLGPLGPGGTRTYATASFDHRGDQRLEPRPLTASDDAILLCDGVFLLRPELRGAWDLTLFVSTDFGETVRRALVRDAEVIGSLAEVERLYRTRYIPGQQLYFDEAQPDAAADAVIVNDDPARPCLRVRH